VTLDDLAGVRLVLLDARVVLDPPARFHVDNVSSPMQQQQA
jgi:hypothetical protein